MLQNQHYGFLKPHSNLVLIECNTETDWWSHWSVNLLKLRYQRPSWGRVLKDQLLRFRATFINAIRHCDVIKAGNHGDRSRCSLSYNTFFNFSRTIRNTTNNYIYLSNVGDISFTQLSNIDQHQLTCSTTAIQRYLTTKRISGHSKSKARFSSPYSNALKDAMNMYFLSTRSK